MATEVTQEQINGFRMDRHFLTERASSNDLEQVVSRVCGIQAQMPAAANLQLWARIDNLKPEDIRNALWTSKLILRTWCMRGTAHYLATKDFVAYLKAIIEPRIAQHKTWLEKRGIREFGEVAKFDPSQHDFEAILNAIEDVLADGPATKDEVANHVAKEIGNDARPWVDTGYYIVTKLLAYEGKACFGPYLNGKASLVLTNQWLPIQPEIEKETAEDTILMNYLQSYGPATPQDFSTWAGLKMTIVNSIWERNLHKLAEVRLNGKPLLILQDDLNKLLETQIEPRPVRLLPNFDIFLLGHKDKSHIVDESHYNLVFKKAAWIAPVLLQEGKVIGTWNQKRTTKKINLIIEPFNPLSKSQLDDVSLDAIRLADFFELTCEVKIEK